MVRLSSLARRIFIALLFWPALVAPGLARSAPPVPIPLSVSAAIDQSVREALAETGTPSASIAIVEGGRLVYAKAYGLAHIAPDLSATTATRYGIASISKEFTAQAILMLAQTGKLSLDDKVARWFPDLTEADKVTVRELLSHTSGYSDYWPQDYVMPMMARPTTPEAIIDRWAKAKLDFQPRDDWQYSNTGYVIAGRIVEKVSGEPLFAFLQQHIFAPLGMRSPVDNDAHPIGPPDATGYERAGLGPVRPSPFEASGWMFGAGELAMTASDLARWDVSLIDRSLMTPELYRVQFAPVFLNDGRNSHYGLGLFVRQEAGRPMLEHTGEISGFLSENRIFPDDRAAIVVLTNSWTGSPHRVISDRLETLVLPPKGIEATVRALFAQLLRGRLDRSLLTDNASSYFTPERLADLRASLGALGEVRVFKELGASERGGMSYRTYDVEMTREAAGAPQTTPLTISVFALPDGRIEQLLVSKTVH